MLEQALPRFFEIVEEGETVSVLGEPGLGEAPQKDRKACPAPRLDWHIKVIP